MYRATALKSFVAMLVLSWIFMVDATENHLICKQINDVFSGDQDEPRLAKRHDIERGFPGKRGAKGDPGNVGQTGQPGERGPQGIVDYGRINATVQKEFREAIQEINPRLNTVEDFFENIRKGLCQLEYQSKCFWVLFGTMTYYQGLTFCRAYGGKGADIYDETHYDLIMKYIRKVMTPSDVYVEPWLAMTMHYPSLQISLSSGTAAPFVKMYPSYPRATEGHTQVNLQVRHGITVSSQGMWNYDPSKTRSGILCEM